MGELVSTESAAAIGALYQRARASMTQTVGLLIEAGRALRAVKASLPIGEWELWVKEHQEQLGFGLRTSQKLMRAAVETLPSDEDEASALSRRIWVNYDPPMIEPPSGGYARRFREWTARHPATEYEISDAQECWRIGEQIEQWGAELKRRALEATSTSHPITQHVQEAA